MTLLLTFIQKAIGQGVAILFGASGEIVTEKSGNLNLGIPGIMYMGGIAGLMGAFFYEKSTETPNGAIGVLVSLLCSLIASALGGLIYSFLTITAPAIPQIAPEIIIVRIMTFFTSIPAYLAVFWLSPTTEISYPCLEYFI